MADDEAGRFYAETYDASVPDWPGEIEFYRRLVSESAVTDEPTRVLELAAGTGRIATRLARDGVQVVGLDHSEDMLRVARRKTEGIPGLRWIQADMRSFALDERFHLVIIPGHSFQNLVTADDQAACLAVMHRHLVPGGVLAVHLDHQDIDWLGDLVRDKAGVFEPEEPFTDPATGRTVRPSRAWWYERATQTAITQAVWEVTDDADETVIRRESAPVRLHCVFRFEMEHLLVRAGFEVVDVFGDFLGHALDDGSSEMVWIARTPVTRS